MTWKPIDDVALRVGIGDFDLEALSALSGECRVNAAWALPLAERWERWRGMAARAVLETPKGAVLVLWLPKALEAEVDAAWKDSPSRGLLLHYLAGLLCRRALRVLVPEIEDFGCAPVPAMTPSLCARLAGLGLEPAAGGALPRRYAVLTPMPFGAACGACALEENCPQRRGDGHAPIPCRPETAK